MSKRTKSTDELDLYIGRKIRMRRIFMGYSQQKVAGLVGITFQQLQKYESGTNRITASRLYEVAKVLDVPITYFFEEYEETREIRIKRGLYAAENPAEPYEVEPVFDRKMLEVARVYSHISDPLVQKSVFRILKTLANEVAESEAVQTIQAPQIPHS